jgi:hypothetical protein
MPTEADTCRKFVVPKLLAAGWDSEPHSIAEQRSITDGRIVPVGKGFIRKPPKRVDYLLRYARDFNLAVVEAKASRTRLWEQNTIVSVASTTKIMLMIGALIAIERGLLDLDAPVARSMPTASRRWICSSCRRSRFACSMDC